MNLQLQRNVSLKPFNTLQIDARADWFAELTDLEQCTQLPDLCRQQPLLILGGGSNIILAGNVHGLVLLNRLRGIAVLDEDDDSVRVQVAAGENWDAFVQHSLELGWCGLENLSAIPGTVGAAPMQNIGAYGVELKDVVERVGVFYLADGTFTELSAPDCAFGYRDSIFKHALKDRCLITHVVFRLRKRPALKLEYGEIRAEIAKQRMSAESLTPLQLRQIIIAVRARKLPDPRQLPNVGSFFKNPVIPAAQLQTLLATWPNLVHYPVDGAQTKVAAGWLIDQLGWKGRVHGKAQVHEQQALVLVNMGGDSEDVLGLARQIQADVWERFGIELEMEPLIIGLA
ncbi:MAG: UDP-N-acetylmuramate dehydrogenase [Gammaproteobacteria bacterium]|nr:UDP-N-acetylmuramate dehydrogenase [Gammaproteobacteria bacterium]